MFDAEAEKGKYGKLVRIDFGESICFYRVKLILPIWDAPTEYEISHIMDEVESIFNERLHYWHTRKTLDCPTEAEFKTNNVYHFSIS